MRTIFLASSLLAALSLAACGGSQEPAAAPPAPSASAAAAPAAPAAAAPAAAGTAVAFDAMTPEQKLNHMKMVIQPTMGKLFTAYDGKRFGQFGCATCHGPNKEDPHKALPKLTLSNDGFKKLMGEKPAIMKFMAEQVTPTMAKAMGEKPFDPATKQGFGCGGCHAVQ